MTTEIPEVITKSMWNGGPFRRWSLSKTTVTPIRAKSGFVGSYVCAWCLTPCDGVYLAREEQKWLCGPCKSKGPPATSVETSRRLAGEPVENGQGL